MDLKDIQQKLKNLRDRIALEGRISAAAEAELQAILSDTLVTANEELTTIQNKLSARLSVKKPGNDNILSDDQRTRLRIVEKTGSGSHAVH